MKSLDKISKNYRIIKKKASSERSAGERLLFDFVMKIIDFYKVYDLLEKTNHVHILELIFIYSRELSDEAISQRGYVSAKTLYRYKKQYLILMSDVLQSGIFGDEFSQLLVDFYI